MRLIYVILRVWYGLNPFSSIMGKTLHSGTFHKNYVCRINIYLIHNTFAHIVCTCVTKNPEGLVLHGSLDLNE